jgi:hypothetical protein
MSVAWLHEFESLEEISQQEEIRLLCLRMAALSRAGELDGFVRQITRDAGVDEETKGTVSELAGCRGFLLALEDYVGRTRILH